MSNELKMQLTSLSSSAPLVFAYIRGRSTTLVVSIAGVGNKRYRQPPPEFFKLASQGGLHHVLFVSDASRSWLNGPGIAEAIIKQIEQTVLAIGATTVVAIGNSMGGTMALSLAKMTKIEAVLAIVPQFSAHPKRVPEEKRWRFFRRKIKDWPYEALENLPTDRSRTVILHGGSPDEWFHLNRFPKDSRAWHFVFPDHDHWLAGKLHTDGLLAPIVEHFIHGKPRKLRHAICQAGGVSRARFDDLRLVGLAAQSEV